MMLFLFVMGQGLTGPNSAALALAPFSKHTGSAASLLGSFRMLIGGVITVWVSAWHDGSALCARPWTILRGSVDGMKKWPAVADLGYG